MKMKELLEVAPALRQLSATKLTGIACIRVSKALRLVQVEMEGYEKDRMALAEQLGVLSEDKTQYKFEGENAIEFKNGMEALLAGDVDIKFPQISMKEFGECGIEPMYLVPLIPLFGFEE